MAHHILARDPPDSSFRDADARNSFATRAEQEPTPAHAPGAHNAQGSKNRMPPRAMNSSENTASRASRSRLEFHKTAHSFPDYGSVKGVVRMRLPGLLKAIAPQTHINTLDSGPSVSPGPLQTSNTFQPTDEAPPPKRQKTLLDPRRRSLTEEITDIDQDAISWTERHGSQTSLAHSVSPGIPEYQIVQESTKGTGRSHRRSRRPQTNHPSAMPAMTSQASRGRISHQDPIDDDFDVLNPAQKPAPRQQRTARLILASNATRDPVDACILSKPTRPGLSPRNKKRPNHELVDDEDELAWGTSGREPPTASERQAVEGSPKNKSPSLSRRGDMKSTKWADVRGDRIPTGVGVVAAVCQPNFRFAASNGQNNCFLRPTDGPELRVFTHESLPAEPYQWLKITGKANTLFYHPDSSLIKLTQSRDQTSILIGGMMFIEFRSNADALWVVEWVRKHLAVRVDLEKEENKLALSYKKLHTDVAHSRNQVSDRRLSDGTPVRLTEANEASPRANAAFTESAPASSRTPIRHQMQVSAQHTGTPVPPFGTASERAPVASRSLRTRDIFQQGPAPEMPRVSAVRRWSDENQDWAQGWDMPLIRRRTTVDKEDIPRLDEGQCLNDNLIGYGLRYLFDVFGARTKDLHKRVYLHNSFFYEKLKAGRGAINYDGVKNWTTKVDLLSFDYIIVPVNEHYHWWVAIICNPGKLDPASRRASGDTRDPPAQVMDGKVNGATSDVEMTDVTEKRPPRSPRDKTNMVKSDLVDLVSDDKNVSIDLTSTFRAKQPKKAKAGAKTYSPDDPRIITLDSLGSTHPQAISHLRKYLLAEFEDKRKTVITDPPTTLGMKAVNIPEQNNLCDCGVYLLGYIQEFVKDPDQFVRTLLQKESPDWKFDPSDLRNLWRETIFEERKQHLKPQRGPKAKLEASAAASPPKSSVEPSRHPSQDNTTEDTKGTDTLNGKLGNETNSSGHSVPNSTSGSPMNVDTPQVDGPSTEPTRCATQPTRTSGGEKPQVSEMVRAPLSPRPPALQQDNLDEATVPIPTVEDDPVSLTVKAPDAEDLPGSPSPSRGDPLLLSPLSSTSPSGPAEDGETTVEVLPASFHSPNAAKPRATQGRPEPSSPASVRRRRAAKARPKHTTSHFVVDEGPVVMSAEVVRNSDPIDLTDD